MKDWKAVLLTLILLALCVVPCVAMVASKETPTEVEAEVEATGYGLRDTVSEETGYGLRDTVSEESAEDSAVFSLAEVGVLLVAGVVITVMCTVLPQMEESRTVAKQL